ncbi:MAG: hypothetical protein H6Q14_1817 [Bacteroidetes bacterium]|jgi:hypothetical protein|nr:hypothetical protein [Bacteroidota bacterium]
MKRIYSFIFILVTVLFSASLQAKTKIELMGSILIGEPRALVLVDTVSTTSTSSVSEADPIEAYNVSGAVYTAFNADLGYVLIEIVSSYTEEVVYSTIVDSGEEDSFIAPEGIDINSGDYYIRYTTVYGDVSGDI